MSVTIPDDFKDLLERPIVVTLVTLMPDGQPQASAVWFSYDGERIWVNTARGRQKDKNMTERPKVTILSVDPNDPYRFLEVRGVIDEITEQGAEEHIDQLSWKYDNKSFYGADPSRRQREKRVIYKIRPIRVVAH